MQTAVLKAHKQKALWWTLLCFAAGVPVIGPIGLFTHGLPQGNRQAFLGWIFINTVLILVSIAKLWDCYSKAPSGWKGRWQLTLRDLLLIVFLSATAMSLCRTVSPHNFLRIGVPVSIALGIGYTVALLFVSRMWEAVSVRRWVFAFALVAEAALTVLGGFVLQCMLFGIFVLMTEFL
jgi:hypothetical protein